MLDQLLDGVSQQYFLDDGVLTSELRTVKDAFSKPDLEIPAYTRTQAQGIMRSVGVRLGGSLTDSQLSRFRMVDGIKRGSVRRVDYKASDGTTVANNGCEAVWPKARLTGLLDFVRQASVKFVSYHTQAAWDKRGS